MDNHVNKRKSHKLSVMLAKHHSAQPDGGSGQARDDIILALLRAYLPPAGLLHLRIKGPPGATTGNRREGGPRTLQTCYTLFTGSVEHGGRGGGRRGGVVGTEGGGRGGGQAGGGGKGKGGRRPCTEK